ncbi:MAG: cobalamin biosynthesis protein P47K [Clostridia bacterium]|jgi:G3E family GTPase|nr:cobalamin biosynthesis protein P47K [Clostridia bacterium]
MKILLFGGFLGSGKTTLILQLAMHIVENINEKVAIIENEVGEIGIDDKVLAAQGLQVRGLFAGCVCCQITGDLVQAIIELEETVQPDWLIIESTGLAVPSKIVETIEKYCHCYETLNTIVVVDAERWQELYEVTGDFVVSQIKSADSLLINKIDLVDSAESIVLMDEIKQFNDGASIHLTTAIEQISPKMMQEMLKL